MTNRARKLWYLLEPIHSVIYFAPECRRGLGDAGLRGFWMCYFAGRAAPLGAVPASVVAATFFNFHPAMVGRAIPDAWSFAAPDRVLSARWTAAAAVLRVLVPNIENCAERANQILRSVIGAAPAAGRPLFAANRALDPGSDPVAQLWQFATALREHRGDGHVALLTASKIGPCEAHVLAARFKSIPSETLRDNRGWTSGDWLEAQDRLRRRGWLDSSGQLTPEGLAYRRNLEDRTDALAAQPLDASGDCVDELVALLAPVTEAVLSGDVIPFPNPMGLPKGSSLDD